MTCSVCSDRIRIAGSAETEVAYSPSGGRLVRAATTHTPTALSLSARGRLLRAGSNVRNEGHRWRQIHRRLPCPGYISPFHHFIFFFYFYPLFSSPSLPCNVSVSLPHTCPTSPSTSLANPIFPHLPLNPSQHPIPIKQQSSLCCKAVWAARPRTKFETPILLPPSPRPNNSGPTPLALVASSSRVR